MNRRGLTLFELMIGLVVSSLVLSMTLALSARVQTVARQRAERLGLAATLGHVLAILDRELETVGSDSIAGDDVRLVASNSLTYRARRAMAVGCRVAPDTVMIATDSLAAFRARVPDPVRDSLLVWVPGDSIGPEGWVPVALSAGPFAAICPTGETAVRYAASVDSSTALRLAPSGRTVVVSFESINARAYAGAGGWQFGIEGLSAGASVQPAAGRLQGANGLELSLLDRFGGPLSLGGSLAGLAVVVRAQSHRALAVGPGQVASAQDSAALAIRFRNAP